MTEHALSCASCGYDLTRDEIEDQQTDSDGDLICDCCWREENVFACCSCFEDGDKRIQHKMLVVFESTPGTASDVLPGIYRITSNPYYLDGIIKGALVSDHLQRICDLPEHMRNKSREYPCGHLCQECQDKIIEMASGVTSPREENAKP